MNQEVRDQMIDEITKEMYKRNWMTLRDIHAFISKKNLAFALEEEAIRFYESVIENMSIEHLICSPGVETHVKQLTFAGKLIVEKGGWLEYLKAKDLKESAEINHQIRQMKLTEWQVKTKWVPYIVSFISLCISVAALVKSYKTDKPDPVKSDAVLQPMQTRADSVPGDTAKIK